MSSGGTPGKCSGREREHRTRSYLLGFRVPGVQVPDRRDHLHRILRLVQQSVEASREGEVWPALGVEGEVLWNVLHELDSETNNNKFSGCCVL